LGNCADTNQNDLSIVLALQRRAAPVSRGLPSERVRLAEWAPEDKEISVEASIAKVLGSEALHVIIDENVQIHGGNGFVKDYPAEDHYRNARVIGLPAPSSPSGTTLPILLTYESMSLY
jgi:alkylation response protein AidB-like acyl-CoA dehydrogenase